MPDVLSDEALYARIQGGDLAAFDTLYARYEARLFGFILSQTRSRQDAEEIFQEAFMNALKAKPVELNDGGFRCWLFRIAKNVLLNRVRSGARQQSAVAQIPEPEPRPTAQDELSGREREQALAKAVRGLSEAQQELYRLRTAGLSYEEIAAVLEVPLGTLKSRFHTLVTTLREAMEPWTAR